MQYSNKSQNVTTYEKKFQQVKISNWKNYWTKSTNYSHKSNKNIFVGPELD